MAEPLSPIERKVYHYLIDFLAENTYQPSIREIGRKFRIKSTKTVSDLLQSLTTKGYIERDPSRSRGVRILGYAGPTKVQPVPYYGHIHAGEPALLPEHRAGYISLDRRFVPGDDAFFMRAEGDSMTGRGILDGDYLLLSPSAPPKAGDIVGVRLDDGTTVKTLREQTEISITLDAAKEGEPSINALVGTYTILGVVCGVFRPSFDQETFDGAIST